MRQWAWAVIKVAPFSLSPFHPPRHFLPAFLPRSLEPISSIEVAAGRPPHHRLISRSLKRITSPCGILDPYIHSISFSFSLTPSLQFEFCSCRDSDADLRNQMGLKVNPPLLFFPLLTVLTAETRLWFVSSLLGRKNSASWS